MIKGVVGLPGHGKTLYALFVMLQALQRGYTVATNIRLTSRCPFADRVIFLDDDAHPVFRFPSPERFVNGVRIAAKSYCAFWHYMPPGVFYVLDELDNYLDSMDFQRLADVATDARLYFKQHRKRRDPATGKNDEIIWIAQDLENAWVRLRRMTNSYIRCEWNRAMSPIVRAFPISMSAFIREEYASATFRPESKISEGRFSYSEAQVMFPWYVTEQIIGDAAQYNWGSN